MQEHVPLLPLPDLCALIIPRQALFYFWEGWVWLKVLSFTPCHKHSSICTACTRSRAIRSVKVWKVVIKISCCWLWWQPTQGMWKLIPAVCNVAVSCRTIISIGMFKMSYCRTSVKDGAHPNVVRHTGIRVVYEPCMILTPDRSLVTWYFECWDSWNNQFLRRTVTHTNCSICV